MPERSSGRSPRSSGRPYLVVANRRAGRGEAHALLADVERALGGPPAQVLELDLTAAFGRALNAAIDDLRCASVGPERSSGRVLVVCIGGDGTLSLTFDALADPSVATLGVVPCGSGNDLALSLSIPPGAGAFEVLTRGDERAIDCGTVNGRRFLNCVGMGLDAEVAAMAAQIRERGIARGFSYYAAALRGLLMVRSVGAEVTTAAGATRYDDLVMLTVGNGRWYGGGFHGAPEADLDDGVFDCYAFADVPGLHRRFALMQRIRAGRHLDEANVTALRTDWLDVVFDRTVAMHVDGELAQAQRVEVRLVRRGARVIASSR